MTSEGYAGGWVLHGAWRSTSSYRVRIALNWKGISFRSVPIALPTGEQRSEAFRALNPQALVPVLQAPDARFIQSPAILEWLEETHPTPPLLPGKPAARAHVRALCAVMACEVHPINNLRVLEYLRGELSQPEPAVMAWIAHWMHEGMRTTEALIERDGGRFAFGDSATLADCYLVPQLYSARRFNVDLSAYPLSTAAAARAEALPAFAAAAPELQPDAVKPN